MPDTRVERGTCRFVAQIAEGGRPVIALQFFHRTGSILDHAMLSFNLLGGLTLEQAKKLAEGLNEQVLDASVAVSSEHPMFGRDSSLASLFS
jgi:hypothetical protein